MKAKEKVAQYLEDRTKPVLAAVIANHYLLAKRTVQSSLKELEDEGKITRIKKGGYHLYAWKRQEPVAVPAQSLKLSNTPAYNRPIQNSYPLARGYDD